MIGEEPVKFQNDVSGYVEKHERFGATVTEKLGKTEQDGMFIEVLDIEYADKDGKRFSFKTLLPDGWRLLRKARNVMQADTENKQIHYGDHDIEINVYSVPDGEPLPEAVESDELKRKVNPETRDVIEVHSKPQIGRKGFFLTLLHEVGHAVEFEKMDEDERRKYHEVRKKMGSKKVSELSGEENLLYDKYVIQNERGSWEWALGQLEKLRSTGLNLIPEAENEKQVLRAIEGAMATYESLDEDAFWNGWKDARFKT